MTATLPRRSWTGTTAARCMACGHLFSTVSNFDRHRTPRGCGDPATLTHTSRTGKTSRVFKAVERKGSGTVWVGFSERPDFSTEDAA